MQHTVVRSYVLHPYHLVKDPRTGVQTTDVYGVLDGDLDMFLKAALADEIKTRRHRKPPAAIASVAQ